MKTAHRLLSKLVALLIILILTLIGVELALQGASYVRSAVSGDGEVLYRFLHGTHDAYPEMARAVSADDGRLKHGVWGVVWTPRAVGLQSETTGPHGFRVSCCESDKPVTKTFYVLGGSTVYGTGVDDAHTLPSYLNRLGQERGWRFVNYGSNGADSTQEALLLSILVRDKKIPDGVIIYHGFNDYFSAISGLNGQGYVPHSFEDIINSLWADLRRRLFERTMIWRFVGFADHLLFGQGKPVPPDLNAQISTTLGVIKGNYDLTMILGKGYGFSVYHFLQPMMATGLERQAGLLNDYTEQVYQRYVPPDAAKAAERFYQTLRADGRWIDLSSIFVENQSENVYFDEVHLGPDGNALVAKHIFDNVVRAEEQSSSAPANDLADQGN